MTKDEVLKELQFMFDNHTNSAKELKQRVINGKTLQPAEDMAASVRFEARASAIRAALELVKQIEVSTPVKPTAPAFEAFEYHSEIRPHNFDEYV